MLELFESDSFFLGENFFEQFFDFFLRLNTVKEDLTTTAILGECTFFCYVADKSVCNWDVGQNKTHVFLNDVPIFVKVISGQNC